MDDYHPGSSQRQLSISSGAWPSGVVLYRKPPRGEQVELPLARADTALLGPTGNWHWQLDKPMVTDLDTWFAELDRFVDVPFMEDGRCQPPMPELEESASASVRGLNSIFLRLENAPDADFLFSLPRLGDVIGWLHPHERVHLDTESLLDAQRHMPDIAVKQVGKGRARNLKRGGGGRDR